MIAPDRKALVTGGASGFGLAIARRLADSGARVAIADVAAGALEKAAHDDERLVPLELDVTDADAVRAGVRRAEDELGGLDTLVSCAGVIHVKPLEEVTEADWDLTLDVNLKGAFLVSQAAAPALAASGRGRSSRSRRTPGGVASVDSRRTPPRSSASSGCGVDRHRARRARRDGQLRVCPIVAPDDGHGPLLDRRGRFACPARARPRSSPRSRRTCPSDATSSRRTSSRRWRTSSPTRRASSPVSRSTSTGVAHLGGFIPGAS